MVDGEREESDSTRIFRLDYVDSGLETSESLREVDVNMAEEGREGRR